MSESRWGKAKDSTVPVLLGTLIVAMFYTTTSRNNRMADMENRLGARITAVGDRVDQLEMELSDRITRLETLMEVHLEANSGQAGARGGQ